ncbi:MAG: hypothetical protein OEY96_09015 [Gammaproteobacteria bacterium]|nr:hypothetical protein [Gammaproteobacteria bacterium]
MDNSVYQTPESEIINKYERRGSPLRAVALAAIVDLVGSSIIAVIFYAVYSGYLESTGIPLERLGEEVANLSVFSIDFLPAFVASMLFAIYCGYWCALMVNYNEIKIVSYFVIAVVLPYVGIYMYDDEILLEEDIIFANIKVVFIYLGAFIYIKKGKKRLKIIKES